MTFISITEDTAQTDLNNKRNLRSVTVKKSLRWLGFMQGLIHLLCVVCFCLSTLLHCVNFILRLSAFKVATWSPAATKALCTFIHSRKREQAAFSIVPMNESGSFFPEPLSQCVPTSH